MPVERTTPQLVKKGKGKKRPGYAGWNPGAGSPGTTKSGGNKNTGSTGRERGADRNRNQRTTKSKTTTTGPTNIHTDNPNAPAPYTFIGGKKYTVTPDNKGDRNRAELKQQLLNQTKVGGNRIDKFGNTKKSLFRQGGTGIGSLLASIFGMAMGIPGLGLLTGGFGRLKEGLGSLNDKIQSTDFARSKTLMDYLDAKKYGGIDARDRAASKNMREARGIQTAMDMRPTTLDPREMARMGLQMPTAPMSKPTFSDPFANTVGTTTKVNAPASDAVSSYSYGTADAAIPGVETNPSYINEFLNKPRTPGKSSPFSNFIDGLYNPEQIAALENEYGSKYGITNTSGGISSDARHMAAMNNLSNSLSPFNNKFGNFIGDTGAFAAGLINELPALGRGFNKENLGEIVEDIKANYAGSFGTPNQTTAEQIYGDVFEGSTPARTASVPTYGTASAEDITIDGGMLNSPFMETQIGPRIIAAENAYYNQGKMPSPFLGDKIRMNMELGNARGFMGPGFADGGIASMFTRRG
jgi:hypothetical protein